MICLRYFILLFKVGCFLLVGSDADCIKFIAGKRQREGVMAQFTHITAEGCVEICGHIYTCFAVNYFRLNATCQLLDRTMPESRLIQTTKCLYTAIRSHTQESIDKDPCFKLMCLWDEICMNNITTNLAECYPLCINPPAKLGTIISTAEVDMGETYTYICQADLVAKAGQNPTLTCLPDGSWTLTNFTCVCNNLPMKYGVINEMIEVAVGQNYTYKCQSGLFEKGDQNPTITCLEDGSWTSTNFQCVQQNWMQDIVYYNSMHTSVLISDVIGIDFLECMQQCDVIQNICLSFFYDSYTSQCLLSSSFRRGLPQNSQSSETFVYYTAPSTLCDMGYRNVILAGSTFCIKPYSSLQPFNNAMEICESDKAKLIIITSKNHIADLKPYLHAGLTYAGIWDKQKEDTWIGWNGKEVFPFWTPGEPNGGTGQNCAFIASYQSGLSDDNCYSNRSFVCRKT
ncbi:hypothetical protein ACJMK2_001904 [Sinanodonta woodiana]|uniref:C-type lectin domain-containing protein n=1 Tax=Sinanodonta woodiana TaxID=1069815 RepID=A0ABD3XTQ1_SINWO